MCLSVKKKETLVAEEDLVLYKVAKLDNFGYWSYYRNSKIFLGKTYTDSNEDFKFYKTNPSLVGWSGFQKYFIEEGGYHLFVNLKDATDFATIGQRLHRDADVVVLKAIVPKGTKCVSGKFLNFSNEFVKSYVVKQVKYER